MSLIILLLASFIFYCWDNYYYGIILIFSIMINFLISKKILEFNDEALKKYLLILGIIFNLVLLFYFKYINFFIQNMNVINNNKINLVNITLPIGISFFTFTQIAYLVDSYRGLIQKSKLLNYALFVTYFPHLIAGPIIHHKEVMPQFEKKTIFIAHSRNLLIGLTTFTIGLFKKVVLADYLSRLVIPVFDTHILSISTLDAWIGALAYTFELYFDFSGYCDMCIGISFMFGIKLPVNFYSPYKSTNIIEFWQRWNITLSRFLRDYLYIPLGGNRKGTIRKYINLMLTMLLGGLWHGANWTFAAWGILHGIYLCINHAWIALKKYLNIYTSDSLIVIYLSRLLTFIAIVIGWVFFRASNFTSALKILHAMFFEAFINSNKWYLPHATQFFSIPKIICLMLLLFVITTFFPNIYQILSRFRPALLIQNKFNLNTLISWKPNLIWNTIIAMIFVISVIFIQSSSVFLYFQF